MSHNNPFGENGTASGVQICYCFSYIHCTGYIAINWDGKANTGNLTGVGGGLSSNDAYDRTLDPKDLIHPGPAPLIARQRQICISGDDPVFGGGPRHPADTGRGQWGRGLGDESAVPVLEPGGTVGPGGVSTDWMIYPPCDRYSTPEPGCKVKYVRDSGLYGHTPQDPGNPNAQVSYLYIAYVYVKNMGTCECSDKMPRISPATTKEIPLNISAPTADLLPKLQNKIEEVVRHKICKTSTTF